MKKAKRRAALTYCSYLIKVADWDYYYGISIDAENHPSVTQHLIIRGTLLEPSKPSFRTVELTIRGKTFDDMVAAIGFLYFNHGEDVLHGDLFIPPEALGPLTTVFAAERIRYVTLAGEPSPNARPFVRRHAVIRSMTCERTYE